MNSTHDSETLLADVVDSFVKEVEEGRSPSVADFQNRYPQLAHLLASVLPAVKTMRSCAEELEPLVLPDRINNYRIVRELARGGMGVVLEAFQEPLERLVALKLVQFGGGADSRQERFQQEGRLVAKLRHPNVVAVHDAGCWKGYCYLALELLDGMDLRREVAARGPLAIEEALDVALQAASGLRHAHEAGIIHRDVKPSNLFREAGGGVKVLDLGLGLAESPQDKDQAGLTGTADILGTPDYLAPEQARNSRYVDPRTDVYGLGCTLFYLLTGLVFREHATRSAGILAEKTDRRTAEALTRLVLDMTAFDPERRPADMAAVRTRLEDVAAIAQQERQERAAAAEAATKDGDSTPTVVEAVGSREVSRFKIALGIGALAATLAAIYVAPWAGRQTSATPTVGPTLDDRTFRDRDGIELLRLEVGSFRMGIDTEDVAAIGTSPRDRDTARALAWEMPRRAITLTKPIFIGKYEVTVGQFRKFVEDRQYVTDAEQSPKGGVGWNPSANGPQHAVEFSWKNPGWPQSDDHPVVNVSWNDAVAFCRWKSEREKAVYRLPTEAEWEYACGDSLATALNSGDGNQDGFDFTAPVGKFAANPHGLLDMQGNVWEWCQDWFAPAYDPAEVTDPQGPPSGEQKVARGGSWNSTQFTCRPTCRTGHSGPSTYSYGTGFRVVREL
ncbi:MAG: SUMF1/EgtB/PvdO family nonheme iron enzyme [Planctomycetales bacterium]|nr:SUMF1/EgtB/PvdO family nonheme iron enzyme [Planctomycetales bacterium]